MSDPISIRLAEENDKNYLINWLQQPGVLQWFPLADLREIEDAATIWISYYKQNAVLTALWDGVPCGNATLYIQPYRKLAHQCLFAIIVDEQFRGKGVGKRLLTELMKIGKENHGLKMLHLEVYEGNPAIHLYKRLGFKEYGEQRHFVKEMNGVYKSKIMMQRDL